MNLLEKRRLASVNHKNLYTKFKRSRTSLSPMQVHQSSIGRSFKLATRKLTYCNSNAFMQPNAHEIKKMINNKSCSFLFSLQMRSIGSSNSLVSLLYFILNNLGTACMESRLMLNIYCIMIHVLNSLENCSFM